MTDSKIDTWRFDDAPVDPVDDTLDLMAAMAQHWTRNRDQGRTPSGIRAAMLQLAHELLEHEKAEQNAKNSNTPI